MFEKFTVLGDDFQKPAFISQTEGRQQQRKRTEIEVLCQDNFYFHVTLLIFYSC